MVAFMHAARARQSQRSTFASVFPTAHWGKQGGGGGSARTPGARQPGGTAVAQEKLWRGKVVRAVAAGIRLHVPQFVWEKLLPHIGQMETAGMQILTAIEVMRQGITDQDDVEAAIIPSASGGSGGDAQLEAASRQMVRDIRELVVLAAPALRNKKALGSTAVVSGGGSGDDRGTRAVSSGDIQNFLEEVERRAMLMQAAVVGG